MTALRLEHALHDGVVEHDVRLEVEDGHIVGVGGSARAEDRVVPGLTLPGLANCHSRRAVAAASGPGASRCTGLPRN